MYTHAVCSVRVQCHARFSSGMVFRRTYDTRVDASCLTENRGRSIGLWRRCLSNHVPYFMRDKGTMFDNISSGAKSKMFSARRRSFGFRLRVFTRKLSSARRLTCVVYRRENNFILIIRSITRTRAFLGQTAFSNNNTPTEESSCAFEHFKTFGLWQVKCSACVLYTIRCKSNGVLFDGVLVRKRVICSIVNRWRTVRSFSRQMPVLHFVLWLLPQ